MILRIILLIACTIPSSCIASSNEWKAYIQLIEQADNKTLHAFPGKLTVLVIPLTLLIQRN